MKKTMTLDEIENADKVKLRNDELFLAVITSNNHKVFVGKESFYDFNDISSDLTNKGGKHSLDIIEVHRNKGKFLNFFIPGSDPGIYESTLLWRREDRLEYNLNDVYNAIYIPGTDYVMVGCTKISVDKILEFANILKEALS